MTDSAYAIVIACVVLTGILSLGIAARRYKRDKKRSDARGVSPQLDWNSARIHSSLRTTAPGYPRRPDYRIAEEINASLAAHATFDSQQVRVHVKDGVATLSGSVDSSDGRATAEWIADAVDGVVKVENQLAVVEPRARGVA